MKKLLKKIFKNVRGDYVQMIYLFPIYLVVLLFLAVKIDIATTQNKIDDDVRIALRASVRADDPNEAMDAIKNALWGPENETKERKRNQDLVSFTVVIYRSTSTETTVVEGTRVNQDSNAIGNKEQWDNYFKHPTTDVYYVIEIVATRRTRINTSWTSITIAGEEINWFTQTTVSSGRMIIEK